jgi:uncharacterized protein with HEPN domain
MSRSPLDYCRHILDETAFLIEQSSKLDEASFSSDPVAQRAFVRSLEIIGEASKQVDPGLRAKYPEIPWTKMARLRDKVIHHYFGVEYDLVWAVVDQEIPKLDAALRELVAGESDRS